MKDKQDHHGVLFTSLRNDEYRRCIEEQQSPVVFGMAATTFAHKLKPLRSIWLQAKDTREDLRSRRDVRNRHH